MDANKEVTTAGQDTESLMVRIMHAYSQYASPGVVCLVLGSFLVHLFGHIYCVAPWPLFKALCIDNCLFIGAAMYLAGFYNYVVYDIWEYCLYQEKCFLSYDLKKWKPDVHMDIWDDVKCYQYVKKEHVELVCCTEGFDIDDSATDGPQDAKATDEAQGFEE